MKILVGSKNPVKLQAVQVAFAKYFDAPEVMGVEAASGVSDQPFNDDTFTGAWNRVRALLIHNQEKRLGSDYLVGIEGGILKIFRKHFVAGVMCVMDAQGRVGFGTSPLFLIPEQYVAELKGGLELGHLIDRLSHETNTKHKGGATGFFTLGVMDRKEYYIHGLVMALVPFINEKLFFE